jgi:folate-binding protein YgfZ
MKTVVVDQSDWGHIAVTGEDRVRFLNGMFTSNIATLEDGNWLRTMILTHKARVVSILEVNAYADHLLLSCAPTLTAKTLETLDRHIVMDDVELEEREMPMHTLWSNVEDVWTAAPVFEAASGASSEAEVETRRIEAGLPRYGQDVSEANFPFESPLVQLVDYQKGCFAGQEPVARVHSRGGGGNKRLCGLRLSGTEPAEVGMTLSTSEKPAGGVVTSSTISETFGNIALAYVHKSAWEEGSEVTLGDRQATVTGLPFSSH